jgi:hypothetical protein
MDITEEQALRRFPELRELGRTALAEVDVPSTQDTAQKTASGALVAIEAS